MTILLLKNLVRSRGFIIGLLLLFITSLISIQIGKSFIEKNKRITNLTAEYQKESISKNVNIYSNEIGLLLYYIKFGLVNDMPNLAGLAIGQRDINPSTQSITIRNLEEQKYTSDLINPMFQMLGNMDLSFVIINLFPLIIIALSFNLISGEKESGTWNLVLSQSSNPINMLLTKMALRLFSILTLLVFILLIAKFYLDISMDISFLAYSMISIFYILFWFSLSFFIVSFLKNSGQNAMTLLMAWIMLTMVIPASINAIASYTYPVPEAFNTLLESRDGYHNKWDEPKEATVAKFHKHYPEFSQFKHPKEKDYSWLLYYAMQQMGDDEALNESILLKNKLKKRLFFAENLGLLFPTIHSQLSLNNISKSDLGNYLQFISALERFHEKNRLYFYPKIFNNETIQAQELNKINLTHFTEKQKINWAWNLCPLAITSFILFLFSFKKLTYKLR
jgi:ABC-2 type transport system permease protein